jgi:CheY-like chemotaxis protein
VVVLDLALPKLDGFDACRRIREQAWAHETRFVALTGWNRDEDHERARDAGFTAHLVKPVEFTKLLKVIAETK